MALEGHTVTRAQFEENLHWKARSPEYRGDIVPLLNANAREEFDFDEALAHVRDRVIARLPGNPWQGAGA